MKIAQITPGLIEIPPKTWGAIEKIIWNYKLSLERKGHEVDILYLDDVIKNYKFYDIIHVHVANLCQKLIDYNISYYFTMHDHHVYLFNETYEINKKAINNSIKSFVPSQNLVELFDNKPYYLTHGVSEYYELEYERKLYGIPKLLCLGNNVYSHTNDHDRKGFGLAIEAAKKMDLPITIAGPYKEEGKSNKIFFNKLPDDLRYYDKLNVVKNPSEREIVELYKSHDIFIHPSELEAGHPNLTLLEAAASKMPVVGVIENDFPGIYKIDRSNHDRGEIIKNIINGIEYVIENYNIYVDDIYNNFYKERKWDKIVDKLITFYKNATFMRDILIKNYDKSNIKRNINSEFDVYDDSLLLKKGREDRFLNSKIYDGIVVDIGAKKGNFSAYVSKKGANTIISVEPYIDNFNILKKNRPLNSILYHRMISDISNTYYLQNNERVKTISLNDIIQENNLSCIDVLYIDMEGLEFDILNKIPDYLFDNIKSIVFEYYKRYDKNGSKFQTFKSKLSNFKIDVIENINVSEKMIRLTNYSFDENEEKNNKDLSINYNFINGAFTEIKGNSDKTFIVRHIDDRDEEVVYEDQIKVNQWVKSNRQYYTPYKIEIYEYEGNKKIFSTKLNLKGQKVFIVLDSKSLGDTLAWFPFVEEFRLKHDCEVFVSTFWNFLFDKDYYSKINFVEPGNEVKNIYAQYTVGIHNNGLKDKRKNPVDTRKVPLQKIAADYLGIDFEEIKPVLKYKQQNYNIKHKVTFAIHSTSQAKYWNNPNGWNEVVDYLNKKKIKPTLISKEENGFMNNEHPPEDKIISKSGDFSIDDRIKDILESKFFIGISGGLSWLAWALRKPVILISGFTDPWYEPQKGIYRIHNDKVCHGCWHRHVFDKGDWFWCPDQKGTDRQFECSVNISSDYVIDVIKNENLLE